jgi:hypothetical protein
MASPLSSVVASRLEKAAVDNGFDRELPAVGEKGTMGSVLYY